MLRMQVSANETSVWQMLLNVARPRLFTSLAEVVPTPVSFPVLLNTRVGCITEDISARTKLGSNEGKSF